MNKINLQTEYKRVRKSLGDRVEILGYEGDWSSETATWEDVKLLKSYNKLTLLEKAWKLGYPQDYNLKEENNRMVLADELIEIYDLEEDNLLIRALREDRFGSNLAAIDTNGNKCFLFLREV